MKAMQSNRQQRFRARFALQSGEGGIRFSPYPQVPDIAQFKAAKPNVAMSCASVFVTSADQGFSPVVI